MLLCLHLSAAGDCRAQETNGLSQIQRLAAHTNLCLSTGSASWSKDFQFNFTFRTPAATTEAELPPIDAIVVQHGIVAAVLLQTTNSLPFFYANTHGLVVRFGSPSAPSVLCMREDGYLHFEVKAEEQEGFKILVEYSSKRHLPIDLDIGSLLRAMLPHIKEASYDAPTRTIRAGKHPMVVRIILPDNAAATTFPVREFSITNEGQVICAVADIVLDPNIGRGLLAVTRKDIEKMGLPLQVLSDSEPTSLLDPTLRASFATDEGERRGAEKLRDFFDERKRSTTESTAVAKIQQLADRKNLCLSTGPTTWAKQFRFTFRGITREKISPGVPSREIIVVRDGGDAAVLMQTTNGLPCYCVNNPGLFLGLVSPSNPGKLVVHRGGKPRFVFNFDRKGYLNVDTGYVVAGDASVDLDLGGILGALLPQIETGSYDAGTKTIKASMRSGSFGIQLADNEADMAFPVREFFITATNDPISTVTDIVCGEKIPKGLLRIKQEDLEKLGLPIQVLHDSKFLSDLKIPLTFGTDERERRAAEKLREFFAERNKAFTK